MIRVLVVDDSAFMRKAISIMLEKDPAIKIIGTARDGAEGFQRVKELHPDVVTLDIEMPRTNGLECLRMIMAECPTPVLVVSSITTAGARTTLQAMDLGAMDFIPKTQSFVAIEITRIEDELREKVKTIARQAARRRSISRLKYHGVEPVTSHRLESRAANLSGQATALVAIGVSTGGPPVVQQLLEGLPRDYPVPIVVGQHMPREFTLTFAQRLDSLCALPVKEAEDGDILEAGHVFIGKGGKHMSFQRRNGNTIIHLSEKPEGLLYFPSADVLFNSAADLFGRSLVGVILTGMGKDGAKGLATVKEKGGRILAQDEASCVVYGMPKAAVEAGLADKILPPTGILESLLSIRSGAPIRPQGVRT